MGRQATVDEDTVGGEVLALSANPTATPRTLPAQDVGSHDDTVSRSQADYIRPGFADDADELMPEHCPGCRRESWWCAEDVQIRAANPGRLNVQENITRPLEAGRGSLNQFQFADVGEHGRRHRRCCRCHASFLLSSVV